MIEYELSIFLLITSTIILVQIGFRDFFIKMLKIPAEAYAKLLFYLTSVQLIMIIAASILSIIDDNQ
jgi:hypothetical protein